jgi:hypothetical protein
VHFSIGSRLGSEHPERRARDEMALEIEGDVPSESRDQLSRRDQFAHDSALEESGFEPLVPLPSQRNRGTGPMSPIASIRVALVIRLANSISISVATETSGSNPISSSGGSHKLDHVDPGVTAEPTCRSTPVTVRMPETQAYLGADWKFESSPLQ